MTASQVAARPAGPDMPFKEREAVAVAWHHGSPALPDGDGLADQYGLVDLALEHGTASADLDALLAGLEL